jgi:hypothetical protein
MTDRIAKLEAALRVNAALRVHAERLIAAYIEPGAKGPECQLVQ